MSAKPKKFYSRKFKVEAVKRITEQNYKVVDTIELFGVSKSAISKWKHELEAFCTAEADFPGKGYLKPADI